MKKTLKWAKKLQELLNSLSLLFILVVILFVLIHLLLPLQLINALSDNFNKVTIGIAALVTAYFGSSYFREELSRKRAIEYYRKKYPPEKYQKTFKIIGSKDRPEAIFLLDLESLHRHHIWNMKTVYDLGWQLYKRESLPNKKFLSYSLDNPIRTRGDLGE